MNKGYLKIAWRNLLKNKTYSFLNIFGLALGLGCFFLIALYVADELSYDRYHEKSDRIYRINADLLFGGSDLKLAVTSDPLGNTMKTDYPEVEQFVRIYNSNGPKQVKKGNEFITEYAVAHADSSLFDVFSFQVLYGMPENALTAPNSVVITRKAANKYFGRDNVVGETMETDDQGSTLYKITAVIEDMPRAGHFNFDFLFSMQNVQYTFGSFLNHNFHTYLLLKPGADTKAFDKHFREILNNYVFPQARELMNLESMDDFEKAGNRLSYSLMPLTDIHLYSDRYPEFSPSGNIRYLYIFSAVAIFILLLACINFINLSTANSGTRAKEIGIRKVLGSDRKALVSQFLVESIITAIIASIFAILFVWGCLSFFNSIAGKSLQILDLFRPLPLAGILMLALFAGLLAGSYPAFYMATFRPIAALKDKLRLSGTKSYLRNALVVFQFGIAIILIICTTVVYKQLGFIQNKKIGFEKEQVLIINETYPLGNNVQPFKESVVNMPGVRMGTLAGYLPVSTSSRNDLTFSTEATMTSTNSFNMQHWDIDYDYIPTLGMELQDGRNFSKDFGTDSSGIIINEACAKMLGGGDVVGRKLYTSYDGKVIDQALTVIGVVKDFNYESLRSDVRPLSMRLGRATGAMAFKVETAEIKPLVAQIESLFKQMAAGKPFSYRFLDDAFNEMYIAEQRIGRLALVFSILAIAIACLGLFGLATYMAQQRVKEIGVRKVLGASVSNIVTMLSSDFVKLVTIASVIAFPLAGFAMHRWLQDFAYRTPISWWVFAFAGLLGLGIALITVSFQAIKAALANPIKSLRTE
jgi:putative ABC transport system permease protein